MVIQGFRVWGFIARGCRARGGGALGFIGCGSGGCYCGLLTLRRRIPPSLSLSHSPSHPLSLSLPLALSLSLSLSLIEKRGRNEERGRRQGGREGGRAFGLPWKTRFINSAKVQGFLAPFGGRGEGAHTCWGSAGVIVYVRLSGPTTGALKEPGRCRLVGGVHRSLGQSTARTGGSRGKGDFVGNNGNATDICPVRNRALLFAPTPASGAPLFTQALTEFHTNSEGINNIKN
jgi:hypothetical protein